MTELFGRLTARLRELLYGKEESAAVKTALGELPEQTSRAFREFQQADEPRRTRVVMEEPAEQAEKTRGFEEAEQGVSGGRMVFEDTVLPAAVYAEPVLEKEQAAYERGRVDLREISRKLELQSRRYSPSLEVDE